MTTSVLYESLKARPEDKSPVPDLFRAHRYSTIFFQSSVERQELDRPDAISELATNQSSSTRYRNSKQVGPNCQFVGEFLFFMNTGYFKWHGNQFWSISCLFLPVYSMFWLNSLLMFFFSPARVRFEHRTYSEFERTCFVFKPNVYPIDSIHVQF